MHIDYSSNLLFVYEDFSTTLIQIVVIIFKIHDIIPLLVNMEKL